MLSAKQKKLISSLSIKKYRDKHGLFVLEGDKIVRNAIEQNEANRAKVVEVWASDDWIASLPADLPIDNIRLSATACDELKKLSSLTTAPGVLALASIPATEYHPGILKDEITLVLDSVRDPGNLGTIIRTADWFGFRHILCSEDCVDVFNPKVVQASMGAVLRVSLYYRNLFELLNEASRRKIRIYGTALEGASLFDSYIRRPCLLLFGNESRGISPDLLKQVDEKVHIPGSDTVHKGSESLNVASSAAIVCAEIRRREI